MNRDYVEWRDKGRGRVDQMLKEIRRISTVRVVARNSDPGKCSECGYELRKFSFPATCDYCGTVLSPKA